MFQYGKVILFFSLFVFSFRVPAQNNDALFTQNLNGYIYSYTIDPKTSIIYFGGNSALGVIGAIDGLTGNPVVWAPLMTGTDEVGSIVLSDDVIYMAGSFSSVKGKPRSNIAALDKSGNVLPWSSVNVATPISMAADKKHIYLGEATTTTLTVLSKATGHLINDSIVIDDAGAAIIRVACKDSFVFALTETDLIVYKLQYNSLHKPIALKIVADNDLTAYGYYYYSQGYFNYNAPELLFFNDAVTVMFDFIYNGKQSAFVKFNWNPSSYQLTKQNYNVDVFSTCPPTYALPDLPDYVVQPKLGGAAFYDSTIYIGGYQLSDLAMDSCGNSYPLLSASPYVSNSTKAFSGTLLFGPDYYDMRQLKGVNDLLYQVSTRQMVANNVKYTVDYISAHCLTPMRPAALSVYKAAVCPEDMGVKYETPIVPGTTYTWTYSGKGAKIHSTGSNSITIDFSLTPTAGDLTVVATSICGLKSAPRSFHIDINATPNVSAGPDMELNCTNKTVVLSGSSTTSNVIYSWKKPGGTIDTIAQPTVNVIGQYILTVTDPSKGCHWRDTALVTIDTIKPTPVIPSGNRAITCSTPVVIINGGSTGSNDSLRWKVTTGAIVKNPLPADVVGKYILFVLNKRTGCDAKDSVNISSNIVYPPISIPFTSADLTCKADTISLKGSSISTVKLKWYGAGDSFPNPAKIFKAGAYQLNVIDTTNGCSASKTVMINYKQYKPAITAPVKQTITCSSPTISLNGSSASANTVLDWKGPKNFSSANPATVIDTGVYVFTVTDTSSGCVSTQSVSVDSKLTLAIKTTGDTIICPGSSVMLSASPLGGTPGYSYTWKNSGSVIGSINMQIVSPTDTTVYAVTISDNYGCVGTDSIHVFVPKPISSKVTAFQSCDPNSANGQLQIAASNGVAPYQYSIDGNNFQSSAIFSSLALGHYTVTTKDAMGCMQTTMAEISSSSSLPTTDFLVSTNNMKGDTFVIVDISNPRPDKIIWQLPAGAQLLDSNSFSPTIIFDQTGSFTIVMKARYGTCEVSLTKTIYFTPFDSTSVNTTNGNGIEQITIYPNPNNGTFNTEIKLYVKQTFVLQVFDSKSVEKYKQVIPADTYYFGSVTIPGAETGTYIFKVTAEHDSKQRSIIVAH